MPALGTEHVPDPSPGGAPQVSAEAPRSLASNVTWTLVGNVTYAACQWLLLLAVAKLGTQEMVGELAYALAVTAPVSIATSLQLRSVLATDAQEHLPFAPYLGLRLLGAGLSVVTAAGLAALAPGLGAGLAVLGFGAAKAVEAVSDICYGQLQRRERMDLIAISMMARGLGAAAAFAAAVWASGSVAAGAAALCLVWTTSLLVYDLPRARATGVPLRPRFAPSALLPLARRALPLGAMALLLSLGVNVPRYFIERSLGLVPLGVFSAVSYIPVALAMVLAALGQSAMPRMAVHHARGERSAFVRLTALLAGLGAALGLAAAALAGLAGERVLVVLYRADYAAAQPLFFWAALASIPTLMASALGYSLTATGSFRAQLPLAAAVLVATTLACGALVPPFGLLGAVAAVALGSLAQLAGYALLIRRALAAGAAGSSPAGAATRSP